MATRAHPLKPPPPALSPSIPMHSFHAHSTLPLPSPIHSSYPHTHKRLSPTRHSSRQRLCSPSTFAAPVIPPNCNAPFFHCPLSIPTSPLLVCALSAALGARFHKRCRSAMPPPAPVGFLPKSLLPPAQHTLLSCPELMASQNATSLNCQHAHTMADAVGLRCSEPGQPCNE